MNAFWVLYTDNTQYNDYEYTPGGHWMHVKGGDIDV